jgi:DNA replication and repair protein RecF
MVNLVKVKNFRIHSDYQAGFSDGVNIIIGDNGVGKTSLIEAVYVALSGKSWRSNFEAITKKNKTWWRVDLEDENTVRTVKYSDKKSFEINGKKYLKLPKGQKTQIVLFEPDDLNLLYGSPSRRRRWLDRFLADTNGEYNTILNKFDKVLKQRNALLKNQATPDQLFVWDLQFADLSSQIVAQRKALIAAINQKLASEYKKIANSKQPLKLIYNSDDITTKQEFINQLQENHKLDTAIGNTTIGPQKHDVLFWFKNQSAATSASRGENRSIIMALKNIEYHTKKTQQSTPLILLDDIMSELDEQHQKNLLDNFKDSQVIVTSVNLPKTANKVNVIKLT